MNKCKPMFENQKKLSILIAEKILDKIPGNRSEFIRTAIDKGVTFKVVVHDNIDNSGAKKLVHFVMDANQYSIIPKPVAGFVKGAIVGLLNQKGLL